MYEITNISFYMRILIKNKIYTKQKRLNNENKSGNQGTKKMNKQKELSSNQTL